MKLNVIFDQQVTTQMRLLKITVELRDVTYPKALEMILKTNNLMYAQIDTRTIVIAADQIQQRAKYEPFAVRTFYLKNATVADAKAAIQGALLTKAGMTEVKQLNALIVRDTPSNLDLIENLIASIDKSKAEVLIDVNIYEVSRTELLQLGNQFTAESSDTNPLGLNRLGGINAESAILGVGARTLTGPLGFALGLPNSTVSFFQNKGKSKLLASTQIHVLDNEANAVRIGQRVPIQTASLPSFTNVSDTTARRGTNQTGLNANDLSLGLGGAFGVGIPQIQYENVGLNIDITPNVYEDDVQMKMKVESTSVDSSTGKLTPTFNQRTMTSVARVKDGQTTLVAGVSQNIEGRVVKGLPLIGLIPILGRFFSTPETDNRQSDVVITVTPHILRRADITDEDHLARAAGDQQGATNQLRIDQILYLADQEDAQQNQVAEGARPAAPETKVTPAASPPVVSRSDSPGVVVVAPPTAQPTAPNIIKTTVSRPGVPPSDAPANPQPTIQPNKKTSGEDEDDDDEDEDEPVPGQQRPATPLMVHVRPTVTVAARGQDFYVAVFVNGNGEVSSAHLALTYDPSLLEVKGVRDSGMLSAGGVRAELSYSAESGVVAIQMDRPQGTPGVAARGQLCLIVFTVKGQGQSPLVLTEQTQFRNSSGQVLPITLHASQVETR
jgi:general secretion pathway protein D